MTSFEVVDVHHWILNLRYSIASSNRYIILLRYESLTLELIVTTNNWIRVSVMHTACELTYLFILS